MQNFLGRCTRKIEAGGPHQEEPCFKLSQAKGSQQIGSVVVRNPPVRTGDARDSGSIPGSAKTPGGGNGNSLQYSCLENPEDR